MELKKLSPSQVTTLRDFPVHSAQVLNDYFGIFESGRGEELPPCPVIHKDLVTPHFKEPLTSLFLEHVKNNPEAEFFLLDGSHRTTAATLTRSTLSVTLLSSDEDIRQAKQVKYKGELYYLRLEETIDEAIANLIAHFRGTKAFQTVQQKTDKMADEEVIPHTMIRCYRK